MDLSQLEPAKRMWIAGSLLGAALLLFVIFIDWKSVEEVSASAHPPLIGLYKKETTPSYPNLLKGTDLAPPRTFDVVGLFATQNMNGELCAILGIVLPFCMASAAIFFFFTALTMDKGRSKPYSKRNHG